MFSPRFQDDVAQVITWIPVLSIWWRVSKCIHVWTTGALLLSPSHTPQLCGTELQVTNHYVNTKHVSHHCADVNHVVRWSSEVVVYMCSLTSTCSLSHKTKVSVTQSDWFSAWFKRETVLSDLHTPAFTREGGFLLCRRSMECQLCVWDSMAAYHFCVCATGDFPQDTASQHSHHSETTRAHTHKVSLALILGSMKADRRATHQICFM